MADGKKLTCLECAQVNRVPGDRLDHAPNCGTCGAPLMSGKVAEVDFATLQKAAKTDDVPLVVDFWAPWCGPCKMMAPEFARAAREVRGRIRLVKINTEDHPKASQVYGIRGIPTMIGFAGGRERKRQSGAQRTPEIVAWVRGV